MYRYYYFLLRYKKWFENLDGIKCFSEQSLAWFLRSVTNKSQLIRSKIKMLKDMKSKLLVRLEELETLPLLRNDEYFSIRKKIRFQEIMIPTIILIEVFLNYISTLVFMNGEGALFSLIRWGIAFILTFMGVIVSDKLLEAISPNKPNNRIKIKNVDAQDQSQIDESNKNKTIMKIILLSVLLIMTEIAIIGVSEARARDIEGGNSGGILYYGFILLSMALPLAAGYLRWDMLLDYDAYKNTRDHKDSTNKLHKIEQLIIKLDQREEYYIKNRVYKEWQFFSEFKTYKEVYNQRKKPPIPQENLTNHFCRDRDSYIETAKEEYYKRISVLDSTTKLELAEKKVGEKIRQFELSDINKQNV